MDTTEELLAIKKTGHGSYLFLTDNLENLKIALFEQLFDNTSAISFDFIEPENDEVKNVRKALLKMNQKSVYGLKVFFLPNFSNLSRIVQNTLLKNLEETRSGEIFILQSQTIQGIIPTILSRCQKINLKIDNHNQEKPFFLAKDFNLKIWWEQKPKTLNDLRDLLQSWVFYDGFKDFEQKEVLIKNYLLVKKVNLNIDLFWINLYADLKTDTVVSS
jgi:hypothetical protein